MNPETKAVFDKLGQTIREMANEGNKNNRILLALDAMTLVGDLVYAVADHLSPRPIDNTDDTA